MFTHQLTTLPNGLPVLRVPMPAVASATVLLLTNTGSRYERPAEEGIAHFLEHMVFKGTAQFSDSQALAAAVDQVGADFNAFTSREYTGYYVKSAAAHLNLALDVVSDMLLTPRLRQEDIDRERSVIIEELNMYADTPARHISDVFDRMVFQGSGLSHDIIGTKETIQAVQAADFQGFLQAWYGFGNMLLVIAGAESAVNDPALLKEVEKAFSKPMAGERATGKVRLKPFLSANPISAQRLALAEKKTEQAHFILGFPGLKRNDDRRFALSVLSTALGGNTSSRLFTEVREKRGLCYYVHSDVDTYHEAGIAGASAGVDPQRVQEALEVVLAEFQALASAKKAITADELRRAKDYITGKTILGLEDSEHVAQVYGMKQLLRGEVETPEQVLAQIQQVTVDQVQELAADLFKPGTARLALIGPYADQSPFEQIIG